MDTSIAAPHFLKSDATAGNRIVPKTPIPESSRFKAMARKHFRVASRPCSTGFPSGLRAAQDSHRHCVPNGPGGNRHSPQCECNLTCNLSETETPSKSGILPSPA
jgi:hypothetical protein